MDHLQWVSCHLQSPLALYIFLIQEAFLALREKYQRRKLNFFEWNLFLIFQFFINFLCLNHLKGNFQIFIRLLSLLKVWEYHPPYLESEFSLQESQVASFLDHLALILIELSTYLCVHYDFYLARRILIPELYCLSYPLLSHPCYSSTPSWLLMILDPISY